MCSFSVFKTFYFVLECGRFIMWQFQVESKVAQHCCCSVVSDSLRPHGLQHVRLPCPSPTPEAYSNCCPSSWWCRPAISSPFPPAFNLSQHQGLFQWVGFHIRWPRYWSFGLLWTQPYTCIYPFSPKLPSGCHITLSRYSSIIFLIYLFLIGG